MHALITNDDGVRSTGIQTLAQAAVAAGLDITIVAPHEERSGSSAALSATRPYVLNVNVPDVPAADLRGLKPTTALARFGAVQAEIGERGQGYVSMTFAEIADEAEADTDVAWLRQGWATATALQPPCPDPSMDLSELHLSTMGQRRTD